MLVSYPRGAKHARYTCQRGAMEYAEPACQSLAGRGLDELIARLWPAGTFVDFCAETRAGWERGDIPAP